MSMTGLLAIATLGLGAALPTFTAQAQTLKTLTSIVGSGDGCAPASGLLKVGGALFGTTPCGGASGYGAVFKVDPTSGSETVVYSFAGGNDARDAGAALINAGGTLYGTTFDGGASGLGTVFKINPTTGAEAVVYSFGGGNDGHNPGVALLDVGGVLYGTTEHGGTFGYGTVFKVDPATGIETVVYSFAGGKDAEYPSSLINVQGTLYGTTSSGGTVGDGTVFTINPSNGAEGILYSFTGGNDGVSPEAGLIDVNGTLYGTTYSGGAFDYGTVFQINPSTGMEAVVYSFMGGLDGGNPFNAVINVNGMLYGTTSALEYHSPQNRGTVFEVNPTTGVETVVYAFNGESDGAQPSGTLVKLSDKLYGTTAWGGAPNNGTVFKIDMTTQAESIVYSFTGSGTNFYPEGLLKFQDSLYLTTAVGGAFGDGAVVKINPASGAAQTVYSFMGGTDASLPEAALVDADGTLFGTTYFGGASDGGTVFKINPATGAETVVYSFAGGGDGVWPQAALIKIGSVLYGTTTSGGYGRGTVFKFDPASGAITTVYRFSGNNDGAAPKAALLNVAGTLYGTTFFGGTANSGTIFKVDRTTGAEAVVYSFLGGSDGQYPQSALIDVGGTLYGTTSAGGVYGVGTVFTINLASGAETVIHTFTGGADGGFLYVGLLNAGGMLYGATGSGGASNTGTIFQIDPSTEVETVLYSFPYDGDGYGPFAPLIRVGTSLGGATSAGGSANLGTVFKLRP
jgi:uncharacterized repeat protein (TIGR03803 family)